MLCAAHGALDGVMVRRKSASETASAGLNREARRVAGQVWEWTAWETTCGGVEREYRARDAREGELGRAFGIKNRICVSDAAQPETRATPGNLEIHTGAGSDDKLRAGGRSSRIYG